MMLNSEQKINEVLQKRPRLRDVVHLTFWNRIEFADNCRKKAKLESPPGYFAMEYACILAACFNDRKCIDEVLKNGFDINAIREKTINRQVEVCGTIGLVLCDLGHYIDGIKYLEKSVEFCPEDSNDLRILSTVLLCLRMNKKADWDKKLEYIKALEYKVGKLDARENVDMFLILIRIYIDKKMFNEAMELLKDFTKEDLKKYGFLWAELYFAQGDFKASVIAFEKYTLPKHFHFWHPQYDYKKALAYYYSGQMKKCRKQALKIRRRKRWDRFYRLEDLEDNGVTREPFIDEIIDSNTKDFCVWDFDRLSHYRKMLWVIFKAWLKWHPYLVFAILVIIVALLLYWWASTNQPVRIPRPSRYI